MLGQRLYLASVCYEDVKHDVRRVAQTLKELMELARWAYSLLHDQADCGGT
jgi:hypothetical protein